MAFDVRSVVGNQPKMLWLLIYKVIDRQFLSKFSWTGNSSAGKPQKHGMKHFPNITETLHLILKEIDVNYTHDHFIKYLKTKVLKYAADKAKKIITVNTISVPDSIELNRSKDHNEHESFAENIDMDLKSPIGLGASMHGQKSVNSIAPKHGQYRLRDQEQDEPFEENTHESLKRSFRTLKHGQRSMNSIAPKQEQFRYVS